MLSDRDNAKTYLLNEKKNGETIDDENKKKEKNRLH